MLRGEFLAGAAGANSLKAKLMIKFIHLTAAAAIFVCGVAAADPVKTIDVQISYDAALLMSDDGVDEVIQSIRQQAINACKYDSSTSASYTAIGRRDHACTDSVIEKAIAAIKAEQMDQGISVHQKFAQITPRTEQR